MKSIPRYWRLRALLAVGLLFSSLQSQAGPTVDTGFSPEGSAQALVLSTLERARETIRLMGYTFTSPEIARELSEAKLRGVDVKIVLDAEGNRSRASQAAINVLVSAGIPVRTVSAYRILHDKVIVVDGKTVSTGSFNFTRSAAEANSENVLVVSDMPELASRYLTHWQSRWESGQDWKLPY
jgi:phosphatidylserine/phosphatidylglycerophosphate/cardiolipin synthase-like enzyme